MATLVASLSASPREAGDEGGFSARGSSSGQPSRGHRVGEAETEVKGLAWGSHLSLMLKAFGLWAPVPRGGLAGEDRPWGCPSLPPSKGPLLQPRQHPSRGTPVHRFKSGEQARGLWLQHWDCCGCPRAGADTAQQDHPGLPGGNNARKRLLSPAGPVGTAWSRCKAAAAAPVPVGTERGGCAGPGLRRARADYIPQGAPRRPVTPPSPIGR